jgi:hypothetical protein
MMASDETDERKLLPNPNSATVAGLFHAALIRQTARFIELE